MRPSAATSTVPRRVAFVTAAGGSLAVPHTNPTAVDTNGDGFYDGGEVIELTDPNDPGSHP